MRLAEVTFSGEPEKAWPGRQKEHQGAGVLDARWGKCFKMGVIPGSHGTSRSITVRTETHPLIGRTPVERKSNRTVSLGQ